jgi:hypothetical protein
MIRAKLETARHQLKHGIYYLQTVLLHTDEDISRTATYKLETSYNGTTAMHELRAMSITHFEVLTLRIRFDDKTSRPKCKRNDKFAAIREIWDMFTVKCKMYYTF